MKSTTKLTYQGSRYPHEYSNYLPSCIGEKNNLIFANEINDPELTLMNNWP